MELHFSFEDDPYSCVMCQEFTCGLDGFCSDCREKLVSSLEDEVASTQEAEDARLILAYPQFAVRKPSLVPPAGEGVVLEDDDHGCAHPSHPESDDL